MRIKSLLLSFFRSVLEFLAPSLTHSEKTGTAILSRSLHELHEQYEFTKNSFLKNFYDCQTS